MKTLKTYKYPLYAFLLFLPTIVGMGMFFYLLFALVVLFFEREELTLKIAQLRKTPFARSNWVFWVVILILISSTINKFVNGIDIESIRSLYASFYLLPLLLISSQLSASRRLFVFLVFLTAIESIVGVVEYLSGVRSFFINDPLNRIDDYSLLYNSRVFGLSSNSSVFAYKILIGLILVDYIKVKKWLNWTFRIVLTIGLVISFGRTVIIAMSVYWILTTISGIIRNRKEIYSSSRLQFGVIICVLMLVFSKPIAYQFSRGGHEVDNAFGKINKLELTTPEPSSAAEKNALPLLPGEIDESKQGWGDKIFQEANSIQSSGRKKIWLNYINFIEDHLLFGFGSDKLLFRVYNEKTEAYKLIHAHNSFLQLLATNGLIITLLYVMLYLLLFKRQNWIAITAILIYSLGNYGIFWGFSYLDVIFVIFLTHQFKRDYDNA